MDTASLVTWTIGTLISAGGLFFAWRIDRRQRGSETPIVEVQLKSGREIKGWSELVIVVRNPTPVVWDIEQVAIRPKTAARIVYERGAWAPTGSGSNFYSAERAEQNARLGLAAIGAKVMPSGTQRDLFGDSDTTHCLVFLSLSRPVKRLSIRVTLRSREANARSVTIASKRTTTAINVKAAAGV